MTGKNSADIRLVVDAMELSYNKKHIDTFVIVSGDSDFTPLVSTQRERQDVVGVGMKDSTSDLLAATATSSSTTRTSARPRRARARARTCRARNARRSSCSSR